MLLLLSSNLGDAARERARNLNSFPIFKLRNRRVELGNKKMTRHNLQMDSYFGVYHQNWSLLKFSRNIFKEKQKTASLNYCATNMECARCVGLFQTYQDESKLPPQEE